MYTEHHLEDENDSNSIVFEINAKASLKADAQLFKCYRESKITMVMLISSWQLVFINNAK
jgi:hypothetical protein